MAVQSCPVNIQPTISKMFGKYLFVKKEDGTFGKQINEYRNNNRKTTTRTK